MLPLSHGCDPTADQGPFLKESTLAGNRQTCAPRAIPWHSFAHSQAIYGSPVETCGPYLRDYMNALFKFFVCFAVAIFWNNCTVS